MKLRFKVEGMTCAHCVRRVQEASQAVLGAGDVDVDLDSGELTVRSKPGAIPDAAAVVQALRAVGYPALLIAPDPGTPERTSSPSAGNAWRRSTVVGLACAVPLMLGEWVFRWHHTPWFTALSAGLATVAMAVSGQRFARGAWNQARAGAFGMDALVTLGSGAAYLFSGVGWLTGLHAHLYFLEATAILAFISGGHWLEARTSAHAEGALRSLLQLAPETACLQTASGEEQSTPIADLRIGDRVVVRSGDRVPTDAEVAEGMSTLDESMLTGESIPVAKGPGDSLYAGTVNREGRMIARVTASGENTALAQVIAAVRRAQSSRAGIQRLADRISQVFVPCVVLTAVGCVVAWGFFPQAMLTLHDSLAVWLWSSPLQADPWANAVIQATAVLVVACPCAMGLATPAALMAAANSAARRGILIRDAIALEKAGKLSTIVFDKTGTLTSGAPSLVNRAFAPECASIDGAPELEALAAGLAFNSKHPLSQALGRLSERPAEWVDVREFAGCGLEGRLGSSRGGFPAGVVGRVGSIEWLRGLGVSLESLEPALIQWKQSGVSCVGFAVGSRIVACFGLKDTLRTEVRALITELRRQGKSVALVSGDQAEVAESIGAEAGLGRDEVFAPVRPEAKAALIERWQSEGRRVAFVGDGINDGPALAQADLGIAVTRASDIARQSAGLVLLNADLSAVSTALDLAARTLRVIQQNLFWAFLYNVGAVPLAALGFLNPMVCAVTMGLSDLLVVGNSLRLLRRGPGSRSQR